ncbi:MAG TPA: efflux RND transporter periplasmic adaptor subunit [Verrucomicrobiae bacterium]
MNFIRNPVAAGRQTAAIIRKPKLLRSAETPPRLCWQLVLSGCAAILLLAGCAKHTHDTKPEASGAVRAAPKFFCPMHPTYTSDRQGDCPICNMKLVPVKDTPATASGGGELVPGRVTVMISPEKQQLIGLKTSLVEHRTLSFTLHAPAVVQHDETRYAKIAPRFAGWIRKLHVNFSGAPIEKGQPLLTVYSPEVVAAQSDYLIAWQQAKRAKDNTEVRTLLEAARRKLRLWEISDEEIADLEKRGQASDEVLLRAPFSGHVLTRAATEGKAFMPGETLFEIAELDPIWLRLTLAESDFRHVHVGQKVWVEFPLLGNRTFESKIAFLSPHMDPQTRRGEARVELANPDHILRPDMWGTAEIEVDAGESLAVPASAVLDTGARRLTFVLREDNHLEPREVEIGMRTDDWWVVKSGLKEGERVVSRALFLVDSESQLKAAIAGMGAGGGEEH